MLLMSNILVKKMPQTTWCDLEHNYIVTAWGIFRLCVVK